MSDAHKGAPIPSPRSNMKLTVAHRIEYCAVRVLFAVFGVIGLTSSSWIAGKFLRLVGPALRSIARRGEANLRLVYPQWSDDKIRSTLGDVWENLGRTSAEFVHLSKFSPRWDQDEMRQRLDRAVERGDVTRAQADALTGYTPAQGARIDLQASDDFLIHLARREPMIFVTGHFANWEIMSIVCDYVDIPCAIIFRAANNALVDALIIKTRGKSVRHRQIPKGPEGARAFIDALKDRYSMGLLMDQKFTDGVKVAFMGHEALTAPAAARMALNYKLPIIPVSVERHDGVRFTMRAHAGVPVVATGDMQGDVKEITTRINEALGAEIHARPGQWLWLHRRWGKL